VSIPTATASPWPSRAAYFSAAVFIAASGSVNLIYGIGRGSDPASSAVWGAVSVAASITFALSWPALIRAAGNRSLSGAAVALVALLLSGAYSISAALGSAGAGRMDATAQETATTGNRQRAQASYDAAKAELATLKSARPAAELQAIIDRNPEAGGRCAFVNGSMRTVCPPHPLAPELARSKRRAELEATAASASVQLASTPVSKVANADAKTLARYLQALGADIGAERLNDLLVLLTVALVEMGGGLSLALALTLSAAPAGRPAAPASEASADTRQTQTTLANAQNDASVLPVRERPSSVQSVVRPSDVAEWLRMQGGKAHVGMRCLGADLGCSASRAHEQVRRLAMSGVLRATPGPRGTVLELVVAARPN
jgi:hypothetical protein